MRAQYRAISRELINRVNQNFIEQRRLDMSTLPPSVTQSIRATTFSREQLTESFATARRKVARAAE